MMTITEVIEIVDMIFEINKQTRDFPVSENKRLTATHGRVKSVRNTYTGMVYPTAMEFSAAMLANATRESIIEVIKHECAHALVDLETGENHGHDAIFKRMCARLNCSLDTASSNLDYEAGYVEPEKTYRYFVHCSCCGKIVAKYQRAGKCVKSPHLFTSKCCGESLIVREV